MTRHTVLQHPRWAEACDDHPGAQNILTVCGEGHRIFHILRGDEGIVGGTIIIDNIRSFVWPVVKVVDPVDNISYHISGSPSSPHQCRMHHVYGR